MKVTKDAISVNIFDADIDTASFFQEIRYALSRMSGIERRDDRGSL